MQLIIFTGIQASGKSTFYKIYFFDSHIRINLDMLKTRYREAILFNACLNSKTQCVIDNTNPTKFDRKKYILPALSKNFEVIGYYFLTSTDDSLKRNRFRPVPIPDAAIINTERKIEIPDFSEGFSKIFRVSINGEMTFDICELNS